MLSVGPTVTFFSRMEETDSIINGKICVLFLHVILFVLFFWLAATNH